MQGRQRKKEVGKNMKVNLTAMRQKNGGNISGISYSPRGRAVDKSPSQGGRRGGLFKQTLMFLHPEEMVKSPI